MIWWLEIGDHLGNITVGIVSCVAAIFAVIQIRAARAASREAAAKEAFRQYLLLCFENPRYANGEFDKLDQNDRNSYHCFRILMLNSLEEIVHYGGNDELWNATAKRHLTKHAEHLSSKDFIQNERNVYTKRFVELIAEAVAIKNLTNSDEKPENKSDNVNG